MFEFIEKSSFVVVQLNENLAICYFSKNNIKGSKLLLNFFKIVIKRCPPSVYHLKNFLTFKVKKIQLKFLSTIKYCSSVIKTL